MDSDVLTRFEADLAGMSLPDDLPTLLGMQEKLTQHVAAIQFELMMDWRRQGWRPNAPGLRCQQCDAPTWGKQEGRRELIKCTNLLCGVVREVML